MKGMMARMAGVTAMLFALAAQAQAPAAPAEGPDAVVKSTVDEVLAVIRETKDARAIVDLAEKKVLPRFDFQRMTQLAVGRSWAQASPAQQQALERAFRTLLVRTYTTALTQSSGATKVEVKPANVQPGASEATVRTVVIEPGRKPIAIDYRMSRNPEWKVYDVVVEGLSLVTNYRGSFQSEITRSGIDGLIKVIENKNEQLKG
jgi:phospholipid transport system substrate-binding protein